jgi:biopolymer transport protein ExbD
MAMNVGSLEDEDEVTSAINTTPLVDVMLVLLIIFLITVPVIIKSVPIELPKATNIPTQTKPENIVIAVDTDENVYWNDARLDNNDVLLAKLRQVAVMKPQPEVHIRADKNVRFEAIGRIIVDLQRSAIQKVGFITEPDRPTAQ